MLFGRFQDVRDATEALDEPQFSAFKADKFFSQTPPTATDRSGEVDSSATAVSTDAWSTREFQSAMEEAAGAAAI